MKKIIITKDFSFNKWLDFVDNHPYGNIFQTPYMYNVYKKTNNFEPIFIGVEDDKGNILGVLLAVIQKESPKILSLFSSRSIIYGGPLVADDDIEVLNYILVEYNKVARNKAIYTQFRNMRDWGELKKIFIDNRFTFNDHLDIIINLDKSENELWSNINPKRKNEIKKAIKENTYIKISNDLITLEKCYDILISVYSKAKLPLPSYNFYKNLLDESDEKNGLIILCAYNGSDITGCMLALHYNNIIYDFYAGAYTKYYNKHPNDIIPWEMFLWGKKNGFKTFDFGGAGKPDKPYGVRDYKMKFGGEVVNWGRFEKVHKPLLMFFGKIGIKFWQNLK